MATNSDALETESLYDRKLRDAVASFVAKDLDGFGDSCRELISLKSDAPESLFLIGIMAFLTNDPGRAMQMIQRAHDYDPDCGTYADVLANLYTRNGRLSDGLYFAKLSTALEEHHILSGLVIDGLNNYFSALADAEEPDFFQEALKAFHAGEFHSAIELGEKNLRLESKEPELYLMLGRAYMEVGRFEKARATLRALVHMDKESIRYRLYLAEACIQSGDMDDAIACVQATKHMDPKSPLIDRFVSRHLSQLKDRIGSLANHMTSAEQGSLESTGMPNAAPEGKNIRVGIISDQFRDLPDHKLLMPWVTASGQSNIETYCYSTSDITDGVTRQFKSAAKKWSDIMDVDEQTLLYIIDGDNLHVLCDYTKSWSGARDSVFQMANTPKKVGLADRSMSALATGATHIMSKKPFLAKDEFDKLKDEDQIEEASRTVCIANEGANDVLPLPGSQNDQIVFGATLSLANILPEVAAMWASILQQTPNSVLYLGNTANVSEDMITRSYDLFGNFGMLDKLRIASSTERSEATQSEYYKVIDIHLLPAPFASPVEVLESLSYGRPCVALQLPGIDGRQLESVMVGAGIQRWAANSWETYVEMAIDIAAGIRDGGVTAIGTRQNSRTDMMATDSQQYTASILAQAARS